MVLMVCGYMQTVVSPSHSDNNIQSTFKHIQNTCRVNTYEDHLKLDA